MSEYSYTQKVDMMWEAFAENLEKLKLKELAKERGVHPSTLRTQLKYAPPMEDDELAQAKTRWPKGKYVSSKMYGDLLKIEDVDERKHQSQRHCYWLAQAGFIFYDSKRRGYTDTLEGDDTD